MSKVIRIGTRDSELALWQANAVKDKLKALGHKVKVVAVKSTGDLILDKPLYELGITGIFTKTLDVAMLSGDIDIAVHSMKDVPTALPKGIVQAAVLERANYMDILAFKDNEEFLANPEGIIATGSLRRKAQWLNRYPTHTVVDLRGNVNSRMQKLNENDWNGAIFAAAGLERIGIEHEHTIGLTWMVPAPAQGAIMVVAMEADEEIRAICAELNHERTEIGLSLKKLKEGFKQIYGDSVFSFLFDYKMEYARKMLETGQHNVNEVGLKVGYSTSSHFISAFKKKYGTTPKKYLMGLAS